jgi:hypothetical protein
MSIGPIHAVQPVHRAAPACPDRLSLRALALSLALFLPVANAQGPKVKITGGADVSGQNYLWTVTNRHDSPIVYIQFPHYHADTFIAPPGWTMQCTNMASREPGTCTAIADSRQTGIAEGRSAEFGMRLGNVSGQHARPGNVAVRFADGAEVTVANVEVPTPSSTPERLVALIGFALVFGILVLAQARRRRKARTAVRPTGSAPTADE